MKRRGIGTAAIALGLVALAGPLLAQEAQLVEIPVNSRTFTVSQWPHNATEATIPATWRGCNAEDIMSRLNKTQPRAVTAVPAYRGTEQWYGSVKLGNLPDNRFYFVLDLLTPQTAELYFDTNHNGRLDDDGPAIQHEGKFDNPEDFGFAAYVTIGWDKLAAPPPFAGEVKIWFIVNSSDWSLKGFSHSTHTFLIGSTNLGGVERTIYLHDQAENDNDADFTNDGLYLKVAEGKTRYISAREAEEGVEIDGKIYRFHIAYGE